MLSAVPVGDVPVCDVNLYDAETNADPYDAYRAIRDAGPVVWLPATGVWAMGRYADVRAAPVSYTHLTLPTICSV